MTKTEAKEIALEMWRYLRDNPECTSKTQIPVSILKKLEDIWACSLCDIHPDCKYHGQDTEDDTCILYPCGEGPYELWVNARKEEKDVRKEAATKLVDATVMLKNTENWSLLEKG